MATRTPHEKGLMSRTKAVHERYKSVNISLTSPAKQQREMTTFIVVQENDEYDDCYFSAFSFGVERQC